MDELREELEEIRRELGELRERVARLEASLAEMKHWLTMILEKLDSCGEGGNNTGDKMKMVLMIILILVSIIASILGVEVPHR